MESTEATKASIIRYILIHRLNLPTAAFNLVAFKLAALEVGVEEVEVEEEVGLEEGAWAAVADMTDNRKEVQVAKEHKNRKYTRSAYIMREMLVVADLVQAAG